MRRRAFIAALSSAAAMWPVAAGAQQAAMPVIGYLSGQSAIPFAPLTAAFRQGLKQTGFEEGRNVTIEYRWAGGQFDRLPALAADLVGRQVAVIAATSSPTALVAKAATTTIPIVFEGGFDPVEVGLVASLNRPGGNVTGVSNFSGVLAPKVFELLHELVPNPTIVAVLVNPTNPIRAESTAKDIQAEGRALG
jgi:putative tryptophan/tyrosine transport system substrate-binding protein